MTYNIHSLADISFLVVFNCWPFLTFFNGFRSFSLFGSFVIFSTSNSPYSQGEFQSDLEIHMPVHFFLFLVSIGPLGPISAECKIFYLVAFFWGGVLEGQVPGYWPNF